MQTNPTTYLCYAWPDVSGKSLSLLVGHWGWNVADESKALSWEEVFQTLAVPQMMDEGPWLLGHCMSQGWQILFDTSPRPWTETWPEPQKYWMGALREIYDDLPLPVLEWTLKGADHDFDLDIIIQQQFSYAHVTQGRIDFSGEEMGEKVAAGEEATGMLLTLDIPEDLWPHLHGLPRQVAVFKTLSATLAGLGVPKGIWPLPSESVKPTLLRFQDTI